ITAFHFDAPDWQICNGTAQFRYSDTVLNRMRKKEIRALFWLLPLICTSCGEQYKVAFDNDYFVKDAEGHVIVAPDGFVGGGGSWIDFNNPAAVEYWHSLLDTL